MKILIVSSSGAAQALNTASAAAAFPDAERAAFLDPLLAIKHNLTWSADIVICDFSLRIIDGIQLIQLLRRQSGAILPILITAEAYSIRDADNLAIGHAPVADAHAFRSIWEQEQSDAAELLT